MSTALERSLNAREDAPAGGQPRGVVDLIRQMTPEIQRALPKHLDADRMARIALTELRRTPQLQRASAESLLGALMWSAQLGLEPGPLGHVYLVPRTIKGSVEVVFVIGYRGLVELAYRSGQVADIHARVVWAGEAFSFSAGDEERITHRPDISLDPAPAEFVAAYAIAHLRSGGVLREVIGPRHLARARSASGISSDKGPWNSDFEAMARKTAIRRLSALLPQSPELAAALNVDGAIAPRLDAGRIISVEDATPPQERGDTPASTADVEPTSQPTAITKAQQRRMQALMRERGITNRAHRLALTSNFVERDLGSSNDLTSDEASRVIRMLELSRPSIPDDQPAASSPEGSETHTTGAAAETPLPPQHDPPEGDPVPEQEDTA